MKELELTLNLRNNLIKERRIKMGLSQTQLAKFSGVPLPQVNSAECLRARGLSVNSMKKLANFFECEVTDIFPESFKKLSQNTAFCGLVNVVDLEKMKDRIIDIRQADSLKKIEYKALAGDEIAKQLVTLGKKEQEVIKRRFGFDTPEQTLAQASKSMGLSQTRIRQLEAKAIRKLRHPTRSRPMRKYL